MVEEKPIRILLVDDHPLMREGLAAVINAQKDMQVVGEAENGEKAIYAYRQHRPDVVLMDLRLPILDGVEATERIRQEFPTAQIIVLTTYLTDEYIHRALQAGARAYLLKTVPKSELIEAIRAVRAGYRRVSVEVKERISEGVQHADLTPREFEVLRLIVKGRSNKEIGSDLHITESTVKYHINIILSKLGVSDRTQAATVALERGILPLP